MTNNFSVGAGKAVWRPTKSFWLTAGFWLLMLIIALVAGGIAAWLVFFALFLMATALYSLVLGRRSWLGLPHRKGAGGAAGIGLAVLIAGALVAAATVPGPSTVAAPADVVVPTTATATASASPTYVLLAPCPDAGKSVTEGAQTFVCTSDSKGLLVWMTEKASKALLAERVEAKRVSDEKLIAEKAAADRAAADQAAANEAARVAAEQAAAAEAARAAAEQAAQQQAPAIQPLVEVPAAAHYANCAAAKAAGAAPLYVGQAGYRPALDRDKDGVACE